MLKRVYVLKEEDRVDRELLRTRRQIVEHRNNVARQIKSKLLFYGIRSPFARRYGWGAHGTYTEESNEVRNRPETFVPYKWELDSIQKIPTIPLEQHKHAFLVQHKHAYAHRRTLL
jgi:hypothetical protein